MVLWPSRDLLQLNIELPVKNSRRLSYKKLAEIAIEKECGRFEWQVLDWNEDAIKFYESFQTEFDGEWINCRLEEGSIKNPLLM